MAWPEIIPFIRYEDALRMIDWLERAFGFQRHAVHEGEGEGEGGRIEHAEITYGTGMFMLGSTRDGPDDAKTPNQLGGAATGGMYVVVEDPDAHCERAKAAGAEITREPEDQDYGSRDYSARDPEGHTWTFGTYKP
jgi:uncharacterized glyoxalase superfamily protein PhnB